MPAATSVESLPTRLVLDLPTWLSIPFIVLVCGAMLFIALLLAPSRQQRRKMPEIRRRSALAQILSFLAVVMFFAALKDHLDFNIADVARRFMELSGAPVSPSVADSEKSPAVESALISGIVEALLLVLALIAFAVLAWLYLAILPAQGRRGQLPSPLGGPALQAAVEESLDDLRHLPDARLAIIRCYDRFERVLAA